MGALKRSSPTYVGLERRLPEFLRKTNDFGATDVKVSATFEEGKFMKTSKLAPYVRIETPRLSMATV
jgi:hypothetical protein